MPEPVSITIAGIGLFLAVFNAGKAIYDGWDMARCFPKNMSRAQAKLSMHWLIFKRKGSLRISDLRVKITEDPNDENTKKLLRFLREIVQLFRDCDEIIREYSKSTPIAVSDVQGPNIGSSTGKPIGISAPKETFGTKFKKWTTIKDNQPKESSKPKAQSEQVTKGKGKLPINDRGKELNLPELNEKEKKEARELERVNYWKRTGWALHGRQKLDQKLEELKSMNAILTEFLELKSPQEIGTMYPSDATAAVQYNDTSYASSLRELHNAIQVLNRPGRPAGPFLLSVKIQTIESEAALREELNGFFERSSIAASWAYLVQRHDSSALTNMPCPLLIESKWDYSKPPTATNNSLDCLTGTPTSEIPDHGFVYWGQFGGIAHESYSVYHDTLSSYSTMTTLDAIVRSHAYKEKVTTSQLLQVAKVIAIGYLTFSQVRSVCKDPRLQDIRYYRGTPQSHEHSDNNFDADWDTGDPLILQPWLFFGFGTRKVRQGPIGSSIVRPFYLQIVELGLLLYQLASGTVLTYTDNPEGCRNARRQALQGLRSVDNTMGSAVTSLISACLDFYEPEISSASEVDDLIHKQLTLVVSLLQTCERDAVDDNYPAFPIVVNENPEASSVSGTHPAVANEELEASYISSVHPSQGDTLPSQISDATQTHVQNPVAEMILPSESSSLLSPQNSRTSASQISTSESNTALSLDQGLKLDAPSK